MQMTLIPGKSQPLEWENAARRSDLPSLPLRKGPAAVSLDLFVLFFPLEGFIWEGRPLDYLQRGLGTCPPLNRAEVLWGEIPREKEVVLTHW